MSHQSSALRVAVLLKFHFHLLSTKVSSRIDFCTSPYFVFLFFLVTRSLFTFFQFSLPPKRMAQAEEKLRKEAEAREKQEKEEEEKAEKEQEAEEKLRKARAEKAAEEKKLKEKEREVNRHRSSRMRQSHARAGNSFEY